MCKIAILTRHDPAKLREIVLKTWKAMSSTERDGFGACWLNPSNKIQTVHSSSPNEQEENPDFVEGFWKGDFSPSNGGPLLIHGRTATCDVNLMNTHPLVEDNRALIHNGIVSSDVYQNVHSTNDSELLLHAWADGIDALERDISGYYAFANLKTNRRGWTLDIVRDSRAKLVAGRLSDLVGDDVGFAFATTDAVLEATGAKRCGRVRNDVWVRYRGLKHVHTKNICPKMVTFTKAQCSLADRSLGSNYKRGGYYGQPAATEYNESALPQEDMFL